MVFEIVKTNIVNVSADAIVLPANTELKEGAGASSAIFEAAGRRQLVQACKKIGKCEVGNAVPTLAFNLDAKYIIHAVVPRWVDGEHGEYNLLSSAYLASMSVADIMGCQSIAFPLLASGNNGFDLNLAFEIAQKSIETFNGKSLKKVYLVIFGERISAIVKEEGFAIYEIPATIRKDERKAAHQAKAKELAAEGKEIALKFLEDQIARALKYLEDEENREQVLKVAGKIVAMVIQSKIPPK